MLKDFHEVGGLCLLMIAVTMVLSVYSFYLQWNLMKFISNCQPEFYKKIGSPVLSSFFKIRFSKSFFLHFFIKNTYRDLSDQQLNRKVRFLKLFSIFYTLIAFLALYLLNGYW